MKTCGRCGEQFEQDKNEYDPAQGVAVKLAMSLFVLLTAIFINLS